MKTNLRWINATLGILIAMLAVAPDAGAEGVTDANVRAAEITSMMAGTPPAVRAMAIVQVSELAAAFFWLPSNLGSCVIVFYPWYTVLGRSSKSYLRTYAKMTIPFAVVFGALGMAAELFIPPNPLHDFDPDIINNTYRLISGIRWTWCFLGQYIAIPLLLMRISDKISTERRAVLYFVVFPCILFAYAAVMVRDIMGDSSLMSNGFFVVFVWIGLLVVDRKADLDNEPTYMILTGFMNTSLAFSAGSIMLEWFQYATPFGQLFVLVIWEALVFFVRHLVIRSATLATNADHSSAFVFNVVLAGEMYSEFVFLTIDFNTPVFWGLVCLSMASVIISEGGFLDDLDLWLKVSFVPWIQSALLGSTTPPEPITLEIKAHILRHQWRINDLTMIAEFVALSCGICAVLLEYVYHNLDVGADTMTYEYPNGERVDQIRVFSVLAAGVLCAQFVARLTIRRKVTQFKQVF